MKISVGEDGEIGTLVFADGNVKGRSCSGRLAVLQKIKHRVTIDLISPLSGV